MTRIEGSVGSDSEGGGAERGSTAERRKGDEAALGRTCALPQERNSPGREHWQQLRGRKHWYGRRGSETKRSWGAGARPLERSRRAQGGW